MHESEKQDNRKRPDRRRALLMSLIGICAAIMLLSVVSIVHSLLTMQAYRAEASAVQTPDPYFVPTPVPAVTPTVQPTPVPTPEPTPESPWGWKEYAGQRYYLLPDNSVLTGLHLIEGKLHYFNEYGEHARSLGVDVSYHNKGINWEAVRAQGVDFAIIRPLPSSAWATAAGNPASCTRTSASARTCAGRRLRGSRSGSTSTPPP